MHTDLLIKCLNAFQFLLVTLIDSFIRRTALFIMQMITFSRIIFCLVVLTASSSSFSDTRSTDDAESGRFIEKAWFDGNKQRIFAMALNEVAVVAKKSFYNNQEDFRRDIESAFPQGGVIEATPSHIRLKLPEFFQTHQQLKNFIAQKNVENNNWVMTNVYHSASDAASPVFLATGEIIVHFNSGTTQPEIAQWVRNNGLELLKIQNNNQVALLKCAATDSCVDDANRLYADKFTKYAYPNWIRPRITKSTNSFLTADTIEPANDRFTFPVFDFGGFGGFSGGLNNTDLSVSQVATPNPAVLHQELKIAISVNISGFGSVKNIHIKDTLPAGFVLKAAKVAGGSCQGTQLIDCVVNSTLFQKNISAEIIVIPQNIGAFVNAVTVSSDAAESNQANNASSINISVEESSSTFLWNDPLFENQWHFENTGQGNGLAGADINVVPVWQQGITGNGVVTAVVDDGLEIRHEDLVDNIAQGLSWDYVGNDNDPTGGAHGTSVAGVIGATGNNLTGVVGTAPNSRVFGLRLLGAGSDSNEADALSYRLDVTDLSNNSWGPRDDGRGLYGPSPLAEAALLDGISNGRNGKGTVYCWAAGNGGDNDNSNYDGYANSRYTLAFTASTNQGTRAYYAEKGANILANVPSSGGTLGITTTDRSGSDGYNSGNYTDQFGGTSSASPLACGVVALMLEANPNLTWRDVQAIIAATAAKNDPSDSDWFENAAGYHINHKYGFGRVDADAAIEAAKTWTNLGTLIQTHASATPNIAIPDNNATGVSSVISITEPLNVETVEVVFTANDHHRWGDLEIKLISPSGTESILAELHNSGADTAHYDHWTFSSLRHFGEISAGNWTLTVTDRAFGDAGTLKAWEINIYGTRP